MLEHKYKIALNQVDSPINGGKARTGGSKGTVTFLEKLDFGDSHRLQSEVKDLLGSGFRFWEFDLGQISSCDVGMMGVFIGINAMLRRCAGKLNLNVKADSEVDRQLTRAKLNLVLSIHPC